MGSSFRAHCVPPRARSSAQLLVGVPAEGTAAAPPPWLPLSAALPTCATVPPSVRAAPLRHPTCATARSSFRAHSPAQPRVGVPAEETAAAPPPWLPSPIPLGA